MEMLFRDILFKDSTALLRVEEEAKSLALSNLEWISKTGGTFELNGRKLASGSALCSTQIFAGFKPKF
jgi:hypothetical protein